MVTMKHNHNHKNYPHKKDHDHLWYPPWPWSLSEPPGQEEGAEEEPLPWRSSRWCSGARRSPSLTCSGSPQGLKKELLMMWLSCWSSASHEWIRKVKTDERQQQWCFNVCNLLFGCSQNKSSSPSICSCRLNGVAGDEDDHANGDALEEVDELDSQCLIGMRSGLDPYCRSLRSVCSRLHTAAPRLDLRRCKY